MKKPHHYSRKIRKFLVITLAFFTPVILGVVFLVITNLAGIKFDQPTQPVPPSRSGLLIAINNERKKAGVVPIVEDARFDLSAALKAKDMVDDEYFEHVNPFTGKRGLSYISDLSQGSCNHIGENLYFGEAELFTDAAAVKAWMGSADHRSTLLNPNYTLTGFGIDGDKIVEHFCQPA